MYFSRFNRLPKDQDEDNELLCEHCGAPLEGQPWFAECFDEDTDERYLTCGGYDAVCKNRQCHPRLRALGDDPDVEPDLVP